MIGNIFGNLTVVSLDKIHKRQKFWNCLCVCGNTVIRCTGQLNRGSKIGTIQSCRKCSQRINKSKDLGESSWRILFNNYLAGAKRRNLQFEISFEQFKDICGKNCHYCDNPPSKHNRYVREDGKLVSKISQFTADRSWIYWNGIDRKVNGVGYILSNILPCCSECNSMKGTLDYNDFISRCGVIYLTRKLNNDTRTT